MLAGAALPGEGGGALGSAPGQISAEGLVVERAFDGGGERARIAPRWMERGARSDLHEGGIVARDAGHAARHRFEQRKPEPLVPGRIAERRRTSQERGKVGIGDVAEHGRAANVRCSRLPGPGDEEIVLAADPLGERGEGGGEGVETLARVERSYINDVRSRPRSAQSLWSELAADAVRNRMHALARDAKEVHHLAGDRVGRRDDPGRIAGAVPHRPCEVAGAG